MSQSQMKAADSATMNESRLNTQPSAYSAAATSSTEQQPQGPTLRYLRAEAEVHAISHALEQTAWNRKRAAGLLGISYRGLLYKIRQHNIARVSGNGLTFHTERTGAK